MATLKYWDAEAEEYRPLMGGGGGATEVYHGPEPPDPRDDYLLWIDTDEEPPGLPSRVQPSGSLILTANHTLVAGYSVIPFVTAGALRGGMTMASNGLQVPEDGVYLVSTQLRLWTTAPVGQYTARISSGNDLISQVVGPWLFTTYKTHTSGPYEFGGAGLAALAAGGLIQVDITGVVGAIVNGAWSGNNYTTLHAVKVSDLS